MSGNMNVKLILALFISLFIVSVPVSAGGPMKVIVDTDCDMDDMMAILYLLKAKNVEVLAITTTGDGMAQWKYTAPNILNLLQLAHHPKIPVSFGAKVSLSPYSDFPQDWRTGVNQIFNIPMPKNPNPPSPLPSWKLMVETIKNSQEKVTILSLAPMTNIALAFQNDPSIAENIEAVVISGGAVNFTGNIVGKVNGYANKCSEYNIFLDVKAAQEVLATGVPIVLVPLNATQDAPINDAIYQKFKNETRNSSANFVYQVITPFVNTQKNTNVYFWDPVAAMVLTTPSIGEYKMMNLTLNSTPGPTYGCFSKVRRGGYPVNVCLSINPNSFYKIFFQTISQGQ